MANAIKSIHYYIASPVECCDRCSQGIKHVALVTYRDGETQKYGMDCIERVLANVPTLVGLFRKNLKLATKYRDYLAILTGPVEQMPRGREYFGSGQYFIADSKGTDIFLERWVFHPLYDVEKNAIGPNYVIKDPAENEARCRREIDRMVAKLRSELERIEGFLARALTKAQAAEAAAAAATTPVR